MAAEMGPPACGGLQGREAPRRLPSAVPWPRSGPGVPRVGQTQVPAGEVSWSLTPSPGCVQGHTHMPRDLPTRASPGSHATQTRVPTPTRPHQKPPEKRSPSGWVGLEVGSAPLTYLFFPLPPSTVLGSL